MKNRAAAGVRVGLILLAALLTVGSGLAVPTSHLSAGVPGGVATLYPAAPTAPAGSAARVALASPATPSPLWKSPYFTSDVNVSFSMPGVSTFSSFGHEPTTNVIPMWANGFYMNLSVLDLKPIVSANVTIWGTTWPVQGRTTPVTGFEPADPTTRPMEINSTHRYMASFYFNDYRYFWPGDTIAFNLTVTALNSTPSTIYSADEYNYPMNCVTGTLTGCDDASWIFFVQSPWVSPDFNSSVLLTTSPSVLTTPGFDPNPYQPLQVYLTAIVPPGLTVGTIPDGILTYTVDQNGVPSTFSEYFVPLNHTTVQLQQAIGPYPNSTVQFNITLWLPWEAGAICRLYSPYYNFTWSKNGGWWYPNQGLLANLELTTFPNVLPPASGIVGAGQPVNVSIHELTENVSISSAQLNFLFTDGGRTHSGVIPMASASSNTTYAVIPGLPPGASVRFFLGAKDVFGHPVFSQNFTYSAGPQPATPYANLHSMFFFEALDIAGTGLVPGFNFTLSNTTWSESWTATTLGFGAAVVPRGIGFLALAFGNYVLQVTAFGRVYSTVISVTNQTPFTVVFYVASGPVQVSSTSALPVLPATAFVGVASGAVALLMVRPWFIERRKRMEEEQRRVTL